MNITCDADKIQDLFYVLKTHAYDGVLQFHENGLRIQLKETSGSIFLDLEAGPEYFNTYEPEHEDKEGYSRGMAHYKFGVNFEKVYEVVRKYDKKGEIRLALSDNKFSLMQGESSLRVPVLNISHESPNTGNFELETVMRFEAGDFIDCLDKLTFMGAELEIMAGAKEIIMSCDSDVASGTVKLECNEVENAPAQGRYSEEFLKDISTTIAKLVSSEDEVEFRMADDAPLGLYYEGENHSIKVWLAPRVDY